MSSGRRACTVIVTLDAKPEVLEDLEAHARAGLTLFPQWNGFIGGALHRSDPPGRLVQYLRWEHEADYRTCLDDPRWNELPSTRPFMELVGSGQVRMDARVYHVVETGGAWPTGEASDPLMAASGQQLAVYGSLAPGRPNHDQLATVAGSWHEGHVRGHLLEAGWGAELGYPALRLDPEGPEIAVQMLRSELLPAHWARLDAFEGDGYRRRLAIVNLGATHATLANVYVAAS